MNNRKQLVCCLSYCLLLPQPMPNVARVSVIKILGITFTNHLSVAEHVQTVINSSAQTLYALRTLRAHGMDDAALQTVFRSVVIAKLTNLYASSAWWGFATTTDRQRLQAFIVVDLYLPPLDELSYDKLLPVSPTTENMCCTSIFLPSRLHHRTITYGRASISSNFLIRLVISQTAILCSACYFSKLTDVPLLVFFSFYFIHLFISRPHILLNIVLSAFWQSLIKIHERMNESHIEINCVYNNDCANSYVSCDATSSPWATPRTGFLNFTSHRRNCAMLCNT